MSETITDPTTGQVIQVVEPGSSEDPFRAGASDASASTEVVKPSTETQVTTETPVKDETRVIVAANTDPKVDTKPAEVVDTSNASTEEDAEALKHLSDYLDGKIKDGVEPALRQQQSAYDRTINKMQESLSAKDTALEQVNKEIRELKINGLPEEEQSRLRALYENEDQTAKLTAWQKELEDYHTALSITAYVTEYGTYGVTKEILDECKTPEEMEARCYEAKADYFEAKAKGAVIVPDNLQAKPEPKAAPAGVNAASDIGGGGVAVEKPAFNPATNPDALLANLKNLDVVDIRVR